MATKTLGIVGGLGPVVGADVFSKLVKSKAVMAARENYRFLLEQHPFREAGAPLTREARMTSRKLYVYRLCQYFEQRAADGVLIPCFASHVAYEELQGELAIPIIDLMKAIERHLDEVLPRGGKIGVLASDYVRYSKLFEARLARRYEVIYPPEPMQPQIMQAVYGERGIQDGATQGPCMEQVYQACVELIAKGAELIVPGITELSLIAAALRSRGIAAVDVNQVYADFAVSGDLAVAAAPFKLGIVGGVGPAATVDFMGKVVRNTKAARDQDHIKMLVEQNPQIPDRTANLLHREADPTVALYATCRRLESEGANAIAIPCNTAHAFIERIQPQLRVPIVNMLAETVRHIAETYGRGTRVGLLATSGTIESGVYHRAAGDLIDIVVPDQHHQGMVMDAIYGPKGVKAGFTRGECEISMKSAIMHLAERGASVQILGCTELPLIFPQSGSLTTAAGQQVALIDPTDVLAKCCVALARPE